MGFKDEMKREMRNAKHDVALAIDKKWAVQYEHNVIEVHNELMRETLTVNGEVVAQNNRKSFWSHIIPVSYLKGTFIDCDGRKRKIKVSLGGFIELNMKIKVDGKLIMHEKMKFVMNPWDNKTAIVPHIEQQVVEGVVEDALPDDYMRYDEGEPRMAPGLADQVFAEDVPQSYSKKLLKLLQQQLDNPTDATRKATYEKVEEQRLINYLDIFMYEMKEAALDTSKLQQEATWFINHATHREAAKFGIALFAFTDAEAVKERLQRVALHEEFTGVALFALQNGRALSNDFVWQLCKTLPGWGKVAAVDFLEADNEAIRHWLLTDAVDNSVMPQYIAMQCIEKGKLDVMLHEKEVTPAIYAGADKLLRVLLEDDHTDRLDTYEYAGQVMQRFVYHAKTYAKSFMQFYTLAHIANYMKKDEQEWENLYNMSWQPFQRGMVEEGIAAIAQQGNWREEAIAIVESDSLEDGEALVILEYYGVDVTPRLLEKLRLDPSRYHYYEFMLHAENIQSIEHAATFATEHLDFDALHGEEEMIVMTMLYNLGDFEGVGKALITKALQSNDGQLQYSAMQVLAVWKKASWQDLQSFVAALEKSEEKEVRKFAKELLVEG